MLSDEITSVVLKSDYSDEIKSFILKALNKEKDLSTSTQQVINKEYEMLVNEFIGEEYDY